ncbi:MAG TPA: nucleoside deaminase [bacterium]|nr:nucleoside deaminase [bacterium]
MQSNDETWMEAALGLAREAAAAGEVPVGAVIVMGGKLVALGRNRMEERRDPRAHAEMEAIANASESLGSARLDGATLYVTLEPCPQCAGAILLTRVARVVFGAWDLRLGACGSRWSLLDANPLGDVRVRAGVREEECGALLKEWFREHRETSRAD